MLVWLSNPRRHRLSERWLQFVLIIIRLGDCIVFFYQNCAFSPVEKSVVASAYLLALLGYRETRCRSKMRVAEV